MNTRRQKVIPKAGMTVYNPETGRNIPSDGAMVIPDTYWHRRLQDGEIDLVTMNEKVISDALESSEKNSQNSSNAGIDDQTKNSNNQGRSKRGNKK